MPIPKLYIWEDKGLNSDEGFRKDLRFADNIFVIATTPSEVKQNATTRTRRTKAASKHHHIKGKVTIEDAIVCY